MGSCAAPSAKGDDKFITTDYLQQCRAKGAAESVLHNTQPSEPEVQESKKAESPGIIDKEFFKKIGENFDPKKFNKKF
ncbi:hypothetical protein [Klebsiella pneumoniae]|uniref:hypothetical protein n=1 Tax=Klebsiella pneumoniae TaxID=573 RepID=UPI0021CC6396|nr:hypothetical protein [Klebsiella pneumoniae]